MNNLTKNLSSILFGCNTVGILYGAYFTNREDMEDQRKLFIVTVLKQGLFLSNNYLIHMLKFDLTTLRRLNLCNDLAACFCCFPAYLIIMWPKLESLAGRRSDDIITAPKSS